MKKILFAFILLRVLNCIGQDTTLYTVRFSSDESKLLKKQLRSLDSLLSHLDEPVNSFVYDIQGHTDSVGDRQYNLQLSEKRCESIKKYLLKKGVKENRIRFEKYSFDVPLAENSTDEGRASNRRAMLSIIYTLESPDWGLTPQAFWIDPRMAIVLKTKNGCKVGIPANAFQSSDLKPISGQVEVQITEYNNPGDFIASGIPMSYDAAGKLFMYHSYEMLNIKAFQDSNQLILKNDVRITLNCKGVDSTYQSGFYKFNLQEQKWFEDPKPETIQVTVREEEKKEAKLKPDPKPSGGVEKQNNGETPPVETTDTKKDSDQNKETLVITDREKVEDDKQDKEEKEDKEDKTENTSGSETSPKKIPEIEPDTMWTGRKKKFIPEEALPPLARIDTLPRYINCDGCCKQLKATVVEGLRLSQQFLDISFDTTGNRYFDQRYSDFAYAGLVKLDPKNKVANKRLYTIKVAPTKVFLRRKAILKLKFDQEKNPELKGLKKIKWSLKFKENTEDYASFKKRKFSDVRITYDSVTHQAVMELKEKDKFCTIRVQPDDPEDKLTEKIQTYAHVLAQRKKRFDRLEYNRAIYLINAAYARYYCFFDCHMQLFAEKEERGLSYRNWINYFNAHRDQMHTLYDSLNKRFDLVLKKFPCPPDEPDTSQKIFVKSGNAEDFMIIGLGIYNYDKIIPVNQIVSFLSPQFLTKKGRKIKVKEAFLVLGGINGMIRQDLNKPFKLIEKYKNTLFIVDKANRRYKVVIEADEDMRKLGPSFILKNITATTKDLEGLRKELMGW